MRISDTQDQIYNSIGAARSNPPVPPTLRNLMWKGLLARPQSGLAQSMLHVTARMIDHVTARMIDVEVENASE